MSLRRALVGLWLLVAAAPAVAAMKPDAVVVEGTDPARVLPVLAAMARPPARGEAAHLPPIVLFAPGEERWTQDLLDRLAPKTVLLVGQSGSLRLPGRVVRIDGDAAAVQDTLSRNFRKARAVYLWDGSDLGAGLAGAALAATERSPFLSGHDLTAAIALARRIGAREIVLLGAGEPGKTPSGLPVRHLDAAAALEAYAALLPRADHLVITAPSDAAGAFRPTSLSLLSVPYALGKGAALAFAGPGAGLDRTADEAAADAERHGNRYRYVTVVADTGTLPMRQVLDVDELAEGRESPRAHRVPPFVSLDGAPADRATGRLAAIDAYDLSRWVARLVHPAARNAAGRGTLVLANADSKFLVGEVISRVTAEELENRGSAVRFFHGAQIDAPLIRSELPRTDLLLWEGHPRDLTLDDDALPAPVEPLPPATVVLQGCYTLDRSDPYVLLERGAQAVVGTYMAVYSASGSAFARALIDAGLRGETAGEAVRTARNFLLATVELKKRRHHEDWRKTLRAALSFDLWGDPTAPLPVPTTGPKLPSLRAALHDDALEITIPTRSLPVVEAGGYRARIRPGAELSAMIFERKRDKERRLSELYFAEVELPPQFGDSPRIEGPYDPRDYAWVFSARTRVLSLLVHEQALGRGKAGTLRFAIQPGGALPRAQ